MICMAVAILGAAAVLWFMRGETLEDVSSSGYGSYHQRLFDKSRVHTVEIWMEDWGDFLAQAQEEAYRSCTVVIDGESFENVGLRTKGNNSLRLTQQYGHQRYSLKVEFDHYVPAHYYGLDQFSLDASFQDNSYMKNWLAYDMMEHMGVPTPLCSYTWVRVNGADWGLFLAVEEPEEAFARRVYGRDHGQLYKPDYRSLNDENADIALRYIDDDPASYDNIFRKAKFTVTPEDQRRLIGALKILSTGEDLETAINVDQLLRYFTVQVFVVNLDSYLGRTGHNYFLYEKDGRLSMLPWDYNLAFATYALGMPEPVNDAAMFINYPIDTPAGWDIMQNRPLYHNVMLVEEYFAQYHVYFAQFIETYFDSGHFTALVEKTGKMIEPYVQRDPTSFCDMEEHILAVETIKRFCLLRAESVKGQLAGTIPSTFLGQEQDRRAFIDPGDLWLPDMGEIEDLKR